MTTQPTYVNSPPAAGFMNSKNIDRQTLLQYSCVPHSSGLSQTSYVTIAIRSLHCSLSLYPSRRNRAFQLDSDAQRYSLGYENAIISCLSFGSMRPKHPEIDVATNGSCSDMSSGIRNVGAQRRPLSHTRRCYGNRYRVSARILGMGNQPIDGARMPLSTTFSSTWIRMDKSTEDPVCPMVSHTHYCTWDGERASGQVLVFPVRWRDLPRHAAVYLEVFCAGDSSQTGRVIARATYQFWDEEKGTLKMGLQRINLKSTPVLTGHYGHEENDELWKASLVLSKIDEMERAAQLPKKVSLVSSHETASISGQPSSLRSTNSQRLNSSAVTRIVDPIDVDSPMNESTFTPAVPWLDSLTKQRCQQILRDAKKTVALQEVAVDIYRDDGIESKGYSCAELFTQTTISEDSNEDAILIVELPRFVIPIIHEECFYSATSQGASGSVSAYDLSLHRKRQLKLVGRKFEDDKVSIPISNLHLTLFDSQGENCGLNLVQALDFEREDDNPVEDKYRTLQHQLLRGLVDPALKPDKEQRVRLHAIIGSTSQHLSREEKDLLWRFRFSLVDNRRALTKFLLAVEWDVESEVVQAAELLSQWKKRNPIEVTDALRLLGKNVAFQTSLVRTYAIETLAAAPDDELMLYLLQLVQALKYEHIDERPRLGKIDTNEAITGNQGSKTSLDVFLIDRATKSLELANYLYWYLKVEMEDPTYGQRYKKIFEAFQIKLSSVPFRDDCEEKVVVDSKIPFLAAWGGGHVETIKNFHKSRSMWDVLLLQDKFISGIMHCQKMSRDARGKKDSKEQHLRELLKAEGYDNVSNGQSVPLPSAPNVMVQGVRPETAKMFKSALYPALIEFVTESNYSGDKNSMSGKSDTIGSTYKVIVKTGDDLRQDQLVIMMIFLMDGILKRGTLDLCLKPYSILATSQTSGLVEFVEGSLPISQILAAHNNSILQFFQKVAPGNEDSKVNVQTDVMQRYIRSCAGYCVITYLLGVGDRHLDNIMLQASGHFFHIDFGFIFGRDPKPLPPAFRLTREMVDGMGGLDSIGYRQFCSLSCQAFNLLRKSAGLILNLLHLMSDAGIEDLSNNPYANADDVIAKVEERFRLELTDEQAENYFLGLINDCLSAFAPKLMDVFHQIAVARR